MTLSPKAVVHSAGNWYIRRICSAESNSQAFAYHNERSIEYRFALESLTRTQPRTVLDIGTGTTAWPHLLRNCGFVVTAVDNVKDYWSQGMVNRHWTIADVDITDPGEFQGSFDAVTCISVIEHIPDHEKAIRNMLQLLVPGGLMIITTPYSHSEACANVYKRPDALYGQDLPFGCRSHSAQEISHWERLGSRLRRRELWRLFSGPVWATGNRVAWEQVESEDTPHQLGCFEFEKA